MADRRLLICAPLCFLVSKYPTVNINVLKKVLHDFYLDNVDALASAKSQLYEDLVELNLSVKVPHTPKRRDSVNRLTLEIDDILALLSFTDENKLFDKLPHYVVDDVDAIPSFRIMDGDLKMLFNRIDHIEGTLLGLHTYCTNISADVLALRRVVDHTNNSTIKPTASANTAIPGTSTGASSLPTTAVPAMSTAAFIANSSSSNNSNSYIPRTWASIVDSNNETVQLLSSQMDDYHVASGDSDGDFTAVESRSARRRRNKRQRQSTNDSQSADPGHRQQDILGTHSGQQQRKPLIVGKLTTQPTTSAVSVSGPLASASNIGVIGNACISGVRPIVKRKVVLCIDNVSLSVTIEDMAQFISGMSVDIISIFEARSRRRRNDVNFLNRKAFRLCVDEAQVDKLLDENRWPEDIVISYWFFKNAQRNESTRTLVTQQSPHLFRDTGSVSKLTTTSTSSSVPDIGTVQSINIHDEELNENIGVDDNTILLSSSINTASMDV